jgi:uncharacterized protein YbcC (UPF0753/DUF2309 family)
MNQFPYDTFAGPDGRLAKLQPRVDAACRSIAPTWPLDRFIAVNPHWGRVAHSFEDAGRRLARVTGSRLWMAPEYYRDRWERGEIAPVHLEEALAELDLQLTVGDAVASLRDTTVTRPLPLLTDLHGERHGHTGPAWRDVITHQVSQLCASHFDTDQSDWKPGGPVSLYAAWLEMARNDHGIAHLMRTPGWTERVLGLPSDPLAAIAMTLDRLQVPDDLVADLLEATLDRVGGWAAWCAYRRWPAAGGSDTDAALRDLLAVRFASELLADDGEREPGSIWQAWQAQLVTWRDAGLRGFARVGALWQRAHEIAQQHAMLRTLVAKTLPTGTTATPSLQAVFCIDVRSEVFRRALEQVEPGVQTFGFAGFFGLPVDYTPLGTAATRPQLPGLLAPALTVTDSAGSPEQDQRLRQQRQGRFRTSLGWDALGRWPASAFAWVETMGLAYFGSLVRRSVAQNPRRAIDLRQGLRPEEARSLSIVLQAPLAARAELAARILAAMNLTRDFARLVLLAGHGSSTANNPHAAGLDCGACCGQTGEVNARALASLLNDHEVRGEVATTHGVTIPPDTRFVAALHDTTLDEVPLFDVDEVPATHRDDLRRAVAALERAGAQARAERAGKLGLSADEPESLHRALRRRASDWAETRPEWALANNAAFIAAPRTRTRSRNLDGRAFLHDYDWRDDTTGAVLELIMTAPVVVAHWINLQYFASTVDPGRYGSGNKVLHNVVGGRIGVFEGNGGDLRIGLPLQSVHDGQRWMHEPLRLSVFVAAPRAALETIIARHEVVRQLVHHRWIHLFRLDDDGRIERLVGGTWMEAGPGATGIRQAA